MDTSRKYIIMCSQAKEIQNTWEQDSGDYVSNSVRAWSLAETDIYVSDFKKDLYIWLPRQDQLQDMLKTTNILNLLGSFDDWLSDECFMPDIPITVFKDKYKDSTIEQLWLAFVMNELYAAIWDDEAKEWIRPTEK